MLWRREDWLRCLVVCLAAVLLATAAHGSLLGAQLAIRADPAHVPADGKTPVVISIEVLDAAGRPAPDGTYVHLVTTLGEVVSPVQTLGGLAQTTLIPSTAAGTAIVSAMVGSARATVEVEFSAGPGSASPGSRMVELSGEDLSYSPDLKLFVVGPKAALRYETMEICADALEYDVMVNVVRARGEVAVRSAGIELKADALAYDLSSLRGRLLQVKEDEPERLLVEGEKLQTRPDPSDDPALWSTAPHPDARTWVKARSATVRPREKVILDHASFYADDLRLMGVRRHVMDPRQGGSALLGTGLGYSTLLGASVDIPIYYRASGSQIGSLHVTHNRTVGDTGGGRGWAIGLREEYVREGQHEGSVTVDDIAHPTRGIQLQHQFNLGAGSALSLDGGVASYDDDSPLLRSGGITYYRPLSSGRLSLALSGSDFGNSECYYGGLSYRFRTRTLGSGVLVTPVLHLRHSRRYARSDEVLVDPDTGETLQIRQEHAGRTTSPGFSMDFSLPTREIGAKTELNAGLRTGYAWGVADGSSAIFDGRFGILRHLSRNEFVRLDYSYSAAPASLQPSPFSIGRQRVNLTGKFTLRDYRVDFNASQELGGDQLFGHLSVHRPLPWGKDSSGQPLWTLRAGHMFSHLSDYDIASTRLAVSRRLGRQYQVTVCYSPQGRGGFESRPWVSIDGFGYTYSGGRHFWVELSSFGY